MSRGKLMVGTPYGIYFCPFAFCQLESAGSRSVVLTNGSGLAHVVNARRLPVLQETLARVGVATVWEVWLR